MAALSCLRAACSGGCASARRAVLPARAAWPLRSASGRPLPVLLPLGARGNASAIPGVEALKVPEYAKVPILREEAAAVFTQMPDLVLSGPHSPQKPAADGDQSPKRFARLPLDEALEPEAGAEPASAATSSDAVPETRFARLANGVRIAGVDRHGLCSSVGLFVHAGSRYEEEGTAYLPHALELMAFRSSAHLSHMRTMKTLEQLGATASCRVGREDILYQLDTLREYVPVVLPLMLANVLCPSVLPDEVEDAKKQIPEVIQSLEENTESLLAELLHTTAYKGNTLGHGLYASEEEPPGFTAESIRAFLERECTPDNFIVVGVNVDFDELCKWTARAFAEHAVNGTLPKSEPRKAKPAKYTGGELRQEVPNPLCHLMLGWEVEGGWNGPMLVAVTVLQMFLGGGGSFSTGGPGKGMHTRMYTEVLNRHHWVESCQASSVMYADSGLFTVYGTVVPQHADDFVNVLARIFKGVERISPVELQRAKNALKSSIHMNLEMRAVMMEDIGRQLVLSEKVGTAQEFGRMVDAVTTDDLVAVLRRCLKTDPTVVAYGAIEKVPAYEKIKTTLSKACP